VYLDAMRGMQYAKDLAGPALPPSRDEVVAMTLRGLMKANEQMKAPPQPTAAAPAPQKPPPFDPTYGGRIPGNTAPPVGTPAKPAQPKPGQPAQPVRPPPKPASPYHTSPLRDSTWPRNPYEGKDPNMYNQWEADMAKRRARGRKSAEGPVQAPAPQQQPAGWGTPAQPAAQRAPALQQQAAMGAMQPQDVASLIQALASMRTAHGAGAAPQAPPNPAGPLPGDVLGLRRARLNGLSEKLGPLRR